jgi:hypothetical protein
MVYAVKTIRVIDGAEADEIRGKREALRRKRQAKRKSEAAN